MTRPSIRPGANIAMKIPRADYEATVSFYRDVLGLTVTPAEGHGYRSCKVAFGSITLWLDEFVTYARSELWLELVTDDLAAAMTHLRADGISPCDEVEPLPPGVRAHWLRSPAGVVHLLRQESDGSVEGEAGETPPVGPA